MTGAADLTADLDRTLFVEAGAGTGKTKSLVDRIVALVQAGHSMRGIAAITFTEAAAAELRDRIGAALAKAGERDAVHDLDEAAVSTLHGFAERILAEHPFEAGLPPRIEVLDEIQSALAFDERWRAFLDGVFQNPALETVVLRATALNLSFDDQLRQVAKIFNDHWDRIAAARIPPPSLSPIDVGPIADLVSRALDLRRHCMGDGDKLADHLDGLEGLPERMSKADDELAALHLLQSVDRFSCGYGQAKNWSGCDIDQVKDLLKEADAARDALLFKLRAEILDALLIEVRRFVLAAVDDRRRAGRLEFHDLLVRARDLVRDRPGVQRALAARYTHLLIDEFQDTDPIQVELANYIAGDVPGKLFYVGDGKQSIYRFRRADVELFQSVRDALADDQLRLLSQNYRSVPGIVAWVNHVFGALLTEPEYQPLEPTRPANKKIGVPVVVLGREWPKGHNIAAIREVEAEEVVDAIGRVRAADPALALKDVAILMPTRTTLPQLELTLEAAEIPYRVASASLVWATQEVRDLLAVLRVVDDPGDQLSLVAALRSPALACGDDDLLTYRQAGGAWHLHAPAPDTLAPEHPVVAGMTALRELHAQRWWAGVSGLVERVLRELHFFELAVAHKRPRDRWRRLRWVLDQARAFEADGTRSLRDFLTWADLQADEHARVKESAVPESDDDAVLIYTVHGAKGLQFPAVILTGLNRPPVNLNTMAVVHWADDRPEARTTGRFKSEGFDVIDEIEREHDERERMRLLYVAATRAQNQLVVSVHRKNGDTKSQAALLAAQCDTAPHLWTTFGPRQLVLQAPPSVSPPVAAPDAAVRRREWNAERTRLINSLASTRVRAATAIREGADDDEVDLDVPPWRKGRSGTSVGRAVHATLQTVDLATGAGLAAIAAAQAAAEGVERRVDDIERLARAALGSDAVRAAVASGRYWRELYVAAPIGATLVEGFIDLLYEAPEGIVVVDYKTDTVRSPSEVDATVGRYRLQGAAYALAIEHTLQRDVAAVRFVFTSGGLAVERALDDLTAAKAEVRSVLG
jgi:ATP-dependent exoDNAse (exonuclease V) beta subunit